MSTDNIKVGLAQLETIYNSTDCANPRARAPWLQTRLVLFLN